MAHEDGTATWTAPAEGERLWFVGTLATIKVPGEAVGGRYALIEFLFPRHASPPLHTHPQDESYIVLDGRLTVQAGADRFELAAGAAAGLERLVRDGGVTAAAATLPPPDAPRPSPEELGKIFAAHGQVNCGPPLGPDD